jgi:hypothetical protein
VRFPDWMEFDGMGWDGMSVDLRNSLPRTLSASGNHGLAMDESSAIVRECRSLLLTIKTSS